MRQPFELGCSPEASSRTPALCSSSWYLAISAKAGSQTGPIGMSSASESFVAFTMIMNRMVLSPLLCPGARLPAHALLALPCLGRQGGTEVRRLEDLPNLDLEAVVEGRALEPRDRLVLGLHLPDPEASDELLRLGEGSVGHDAFAPRKFDPRALRAGLESLRREQHAGFLELHVELAHLGEDLLVGQDSRFGVLVGFDQYHESHCSLLVGVYLHDARGAARSTAGGLTRESLFV